MARGWESKSVEDQIAAAEERKSAPVPPLRADERERRSRLDGLMLARAKVVADIAHARDARYRDTLSKALAFIDAQINAL